MRSVFALIFSVWCVLVASVSGFEGLKGLSGLAGLGEALKKINPCHYEQYVVLKCTQLPHYHARDGALARTRTIMRGSPKPIWRGTCRHDAADSECCTGGNETKTGHAEVCQKVASKMEM